MRRRRMRMNVGEIDGKVERDSQWWFVLPVSSAFGADRYRAGSSRCVLPGPQAVWRQGMADAGPGSVV
jgi:hypothetical protein